MTADHVLGLRDVLPDARLTLAGPVLRELRMRKDADEITQLRAAGAAIDRVHARMTEFLKAGRTENQIAADIAAAIVEEGHESAAFVVVGSGPNGASPHHDAGERVVETGDIVVIDIGGPLPSGYNSDCTRTYAVGRAPSGEIAEAYAALQEAQEQAVAVVRPGIVAEQVDAAARGVLTAVGLGEKFLHRTGHGIGLDVHEQPNIVAGNSIVLEAGMAFSIEPGVYVEGVWGARIEDIVVVTADGVERLNQRPRGLVVI
jgi:Xaa-Pro aminopeptidase